MDQQYKVMANENMGLHFLLRDKIKRFYDAATMQLKITDARFKEIKDKYVEKDEAGNYITEQVDGGARWKLMKVKIDITQAKTMDEKEIAAAFEKEGEKMFAQQVTIDF